MDLHGPTCRTPEKLAWIDDHPLPMAAERPHFADPAVCLDPVAIAKQEGVTGKYTESRTTTHFYVAWDPANALLDEATLTTATEALETSWKVEIDDHGWRAPDQTDSCLITVVLADMPESGGGTGGWTNVKEEGGVPFIIINTDWFAEGDQWTTTLLAHEFNHASQFAYNRFWEENDWWYWESTAEWATELVFPEANAWNYSLWAYLDNPGYALDSQVDLVNYGHFTFNIYLTEQVSPEAPLLTWEAATEETGVATAMSGALDVDFDDVLTDYTAHAAAMDVSERDVWLATMTEFEVTPYTAVVSEYPSSGARTGDQAPQGQGQNFLHLTGDPAADLDFTFTGDAAAEGTDPRWALTLSTLDDAGTFTHEVVPVEAHSARFTIAGLGESVTDAYVGVIPLADFGETSAGWSWDVQRSAAPQPEPEPEPVACGCNGAGEAAATSGGLVLAFTAMLHRRRRRR